MYTCISKYSNFSQSTFTRLFSSLFSALFSSYRFTTTKRNTDRLLCCPSVTGCGNMLNWEMSNLWEENCFLDKYLLIEVKLVPNTMVYIFWLFSMWFSNRILAIFQHKRFNTISFFVLELQQQKSKTGTPRRKQPCDFRLKALPHKTCPTEFLNRHIQFLT